MSLIDRKKILNHKFDIGKSRSLGYQPSVSTIDTSSFNSTPGYNISNDISLINNNTLNSGISKAVQYGTNLKDISNNFITASVVADPNLTTNVASNLSKIGFDPTKGINGEFTNAEPIVLNGTKVSAGLNVAGKVAAGAGALYSGFNLVNDISNANNHLTSSDLLNMSGKSTQSKYGVNYTTYNGINADQARNYTSALTTANKTNFIMDSTSLGASLGSFGGLAGMGIGALIGGIGGVVGSLLGFGDNSEEVEREIANTRAAINGYNTQAESEAGSQGLRNLFYQAKGLSADKGKNPKFNSGKLVTRSNKNDRIGQLTMLQTPEGKQLGFQRGEVGKGEILIDTLDTKANKVKEGTVGVDNLKFGMPIGKESHFNPSVVLSKSHKYMIDPKTGKEISPADYAEPWIKYYNDKNSINHNNAVMMINKAIDALLKATRIKNYKFVDGKPWSNFFSSNGYGSIMMPRLTLLGLMLANLENYTPTSRLNFAPDNSTPSLVNALYSRTYNANPAITNVRNNERQLIYNTNNAGGLSSGMRRFLNQSNSYNSRNAINSILADKYNRDTEQFNKATETMINYNNSSANRLLQALMQQSNDMNEAYGKAFNARQARLQSLINGVGTFASDKMSWGQFQNAKKHLEDELGIYQDKNNLEREALNFQMKQQEDNKRAASNYSILNGLLKHTPYQYNSLQNWLTNNPYKIL